MERCKITFTVDVKAAQLKRGMNSAISMVHFALSNGKCKKHNKKIKFIEHLGLVKAADVHRNAFSPPQNNIDINKESLSIVLSHDKILFVCECQNRFYFT
jgi:hypothetical protein